MEEKSKCSFSFKVNMAKKTAHSEYGEPNDEIGKHEVCEECGLCIQCGDCNQNHKEIIKGRKKNKL